MKHKTYFVGYLQKVKMVALELGQLIEYYKRKTLVQKGS